jgi:hypothetical protein
MTAIGKPVKFVSPPTSGMEEIDEMVSSPVFDTSLRVYGSSLLQFAYQSEFGMYRDSDIPDPRLVAFGVKFGTLEEFAETEAKARFG